MATRKTQKAISECGWWLANCLALGWQKADLDRLEGLWWQHHDGYGNWKAEQQENENAD